jgi:hypothetical protein
VDRALGLTRRQVAVIGIDRSEAIKELRIARD